ncbi:beta-N-acetylhexosaminidase [Jeotgalibaca porci]|uniref:beta-N-acetylhexosaminidase n=1 Tax=Jeotgalibaca porci TaxID=1868793 RepID=UPI003F8DA7F3
MKIHLLAPDEIVETLQKGMRLLEPDLAIELCSEGFPLYVEQKKGPLIVKRTVEKGPILYEEPIQFYRALGLWIEKSKKHAEFEQAEDKHFKTTGVMPDVSRNAVLKKEQLYFFLRKMAVMGLNTLMLYIEDIYEIEDEPYFGYMRGRYTQEELKQVDDYAHALGIEVIPAIQTLAHLQTALRWNDRRNIKDTEDILLVGEKETYRFIDKMITAATRPFRTKRIHIGMDEAMDLGLGRYLELNNYHHRFSIMMKHLDEVMKITKQKQLKPMIWSDMFFRIASKNNEYYDEEGIIPQEVVRQIPREVQLVYWDYYHSNQEHYQLFLKKHKELGSHPIFAGGAWTWNGIAPNYGRAFVNSEAALKACESEGIEEVFLTLWADNGAETPLTTALPVMQLYAEYTYKQEINQEELAERLLGCTGMKLEYFMLLNEFDEVPSVGKNNLMSSSPSKFILWQDILTGLFDANIKTLELGKHYRRLYEKLAQLQNCESDYISLFDFYKQLAKVLATKAEIGINLKRAYDQKDKQRMAIHVEQLKSLKEDMKYLHEKHNRLWFELYKPFGWEALDIRYGGARARIDTAINRIESWLKDEGVIIEELEAERLVYDAKYDIVEGFLGTEKYHHIVTTGHLSH